MAFSVPAQNVARAIMERVPGVSYNGGALRCGWDAAPLVARLLDRPVPEVPARAEFPTPGIEEFLRLGLKSKLRPYQHEAVLFLARRSWGLLADVMRSGKSFSALAAATLVGAQRVLIMCTALGKWVWADEITKWLGKTALILSGRGAD